MNILSIKVLLTNAMDNVVIYTDMPCQMSKEVLPLQEPLSLLFYAPADGGADYVRKNFEVEPEIANLRVQSTK